jgi:hypothetical protein
VRTLHSGADLHVGRQDVAELAGVAEVGLDFRFPTLGARTKTRQGWGPAVLCRTQRILRRAGNLELQEAWV